MNIMTDSTVKVAPLKWVVKMPGEWEKANDNYEVIINLDNKAWSSIIKHPFSLLGSFNSIEEARTACQAYHEKYILSQLL